MPCPVALQPKRSVKRSLSEEAVISATFETNWNRKIEKILKKDNKKTQNTKKKGF